MFSNHFGNIKDWKLFYKSIQEKVKIYLRKEENKKIYMVFDWSESYQFIGVLEKELNKSELKRVCFLGHHREGYNWKSRNEGCPPIGGLLTLILLNSISITKKKPSMSFETVFCQQASLIYEMVIF